MSPWTRWLFAAAVALGCLGAGAAGVKAIDVAADAVVGRAPERAAPPERPPAIGPPLLFPPIVPGFEVNAVRTPAGYVLPVLGGGPGAWEVRTPCGGAAVTPGVPVPGAHVVIDPGHGGSEPGAVGPTGLTERDLNLDVALRAARRLEESGATVVLTRDRDTRLTLQTRGEIARSLDPLVFISIHHNAAPIGASTTPGSEVYHQLDAPESQRLAGLLWEEFQQQLAPFGTDWAVGDAPGARARRSRATGDDFYGVLRHAGEVTAVLTESAYLSNPAEEALLLTEAFRDAEADAIARAVIRLLRTSDPGSGYQPVKDASAPAGGGGGSAGCRDPQL